MANTTGKKFGGRKPGSLNKDTADLRKWITIFLEDNRAMIKRDWKRLDSKNRIILFEKLLKYALPTLQSVQLDADIDIERIPDDKLDAIIEKITSNESRTEN